MTETATAEIIRHPEVAQSRGQLSVQHGPLPQIADRPIIAAIARIMREAGAVEKRGENKFHGYKYATAADVAFALQRLMAENGVVIVQRERETRYDDAMGMLAVRYDFDVMHTSGDALAPVQMTGMSRAKDSKGGFDDKATNKCHTAARKYFLLSLFQIPSGDYPDPDADEEPAVKPSRVEKYKAQKAEPEQPAAPKFSEEVIDSDGERHICDSPKAYLEKLRWAISSAQSPDGVWESNVQAFAAIQDRADKAGATKVAAAFMTARDEINGSLAK